MTELRIAHLATETSWRGGENQIYLLVQGLLKQGVKNFLVTPKESAISKKLAYISQFHLCSKNGLNPIDIFKLISFLKKNRIQLLDAHSSHGHNLALILKILMPNLKIIVHRRVDFHPKKDFINRFKYNSSLVDAYVCISDTIREILLKETEIVPQKLYTVRSAVESASFQGFEREELNKALKEKYNLPANTLIIGCASALTEQKGHRFLFDVLTLLKNKKHLFHVFLAGEGHLKEELIKYVEKNKLTSYVTFLGFVNNIPQFLNSLDIFVLPSQNEGLGTACLEAMHSQTPVCACDVGGIKEMVKHQVTGLLALPNDPNTFAENLCRLAESKALRVKLSEQAREFIEKEFNVNRMVEGNLKVYRQLFYTQLFINRTQHPQRADE